MRSALGSNFPSATAIPRRGGWATSGRVDTKFLGQDIVHGAGPRGNKALFCVWFRSESCFGAL